MILFKYGMKWIDIIFLFGNALSAILCSFTTFYPLNAIFHYSIHFFSNFIVSLSAIHFPILIFSIKIHWFFFKITFFIVLPASTKQSILLFLVNVLSVSFCIASAKKQAVVIHLIWSNLHLAAIDNTWIDMHSVLIDFLPIFACIH